MFFGRREHVENSAADGDLAPASDQVHPAVADLHQPGHDVLEVGLLALVEPDRLKLTEPADQRLQHAADRRDDDLERTRARVSVVRADESAQYGQAAAGRVGAGREPLVRQGLPGREVLGGVRVRQQRVERAGQILGLARRRGDGQQESRLTRAGRAGASAAQRGERGNENGTQGRRRDQVGIGAPRLAGVLERVLELRVLGDDAEETKQAHNFLCA